MKTVEQIAGLVVIALALADVFLTVLYARMQSGFLGMRVAGVTTKLLVWGSKPFGRWRSKIVSLCGPFALVSVVAFWTAMMTLGAALAVHPVLGTFVRAEGAEPRTDFLTALYVGGSSISVVGSSGYQPETPIYRIFFLFNSALGMSFISLIVTYLMQVYTALQRRNALGLKIQALSEEKGDGAELVCRLGPRGHFESSTSVIAELSAEMSAVKESHHFYPLLVYFRFEEPYYSVSRMTHVALDALSLIMSTLDDRLAWVKESAGVTHLWKASMLMLKTLGGNFSDAPEEGAKPTPNDLAIWRRRYEAAIARMRSAGIPTLADTDVGFDRYAELRARWDGLVNAMAPELAYAMKEIDRPGTLAKKATPVVEERMGSV